jgi:hypothetical protein
MSVTIWNLIMSLSLIAIGASGYCLFVLVVNGQIIPSIILGFVFLITLIACVTSVVHLRKTNGFF